MSDGHSKLRYTSAQRRFELKTKRRKKLLQTKKERKHIVELSPGESPDPATPG
jgi:hypothetical protein